ncbi:hypothetical protein AVEN_7311-2-1, partial [Araneus ventricosus]
KYPHRHHQRRLKVQNHKDQNLRNSVMVTHKTCSLEQKKQDLLKFNTDLLPASMPAASRARIIFLLQILTRNQELTQYLQPLENQHLHISAMHYSSSCANVSPFSDSH